MWEDVRADRIKSGRVGGEALCTQEFEGTQGSYGIRRPKKRAPCANGTRVNTPAFNRPLKTIYHGKRAHNHHPDEIQTDIIRKGSVRKGGWLNRMKGNRLYSVPKIARSEREINQSNLIQSSSPEAGY